MWIYAQGFHVPKLGSAEREYEDAYYPPRASHRNVKAFRCAVADGATESTFAREWAQILVRGFGRGRLRFGRMRKLWHRSVRGRSSAPGAAWYVGAKMRQGAYAAFVGLILRDGNNGRPGGLWRVLAAGDSCIFHVRADNLLTHGPMKHSADFDSSPRLLSTSSAGTLLRGGDPVTVLTGEWQPRDAFYLATDALAQWVLAEHEQGRAPWELMRELGDDGTAAPFEAIVARARSERGMKNDDTTLLRVEVG